MEALALNKTPGVESYKTFFYVEISLSVLLRIQPVALICKYKTGTYPNEGIKPKAFAGIDFHFNMYLFRPSFYILGKLLPPTPQKMELAEDIHQDQAHKLMC